MKYSHKQILLGLIEDKIRDFKENAHKYQLHGDLEYEIRLLQDVKKELEK